MRLSQTLVTTVWLDQNLDMKNLRIVDIRGKVLPATEPKPHYFSHRADYEESHIPGAVFVDWITDITANGPDDMTIAPPEKFAELMGNLGIDNNSYVVAYDDANGMFAARLWWALNYYGHEQVAVLDGGWQMWVHENRPTTSEVPFIKPAEFVPEHTPKAYRDADAIQAKLGAAKLIDVRSTLEFNGEASRAKRAGHIPGAINTPRKSLLSADGLMQPSDILADRFKAMGINDGDEVIFYCNAGVSASFGLLSYRVAGFDGGAVYDASWRDWGNDDTRPIE